jgi:hypothetical protein
MKLWLVLFVLFALPALPAWGQVTMALDNGGVETLSPIVCDATASVAGQCVDFTGTLSDNDPNLFLNDTNITFTGLAANFLTTDNGTSDSNLFFNVPSPLTGNTYSGPIFQVQVANGTPAGHYFGTIQVLGGDDFGNFTDFDPLLAQAATFEVIVPSPEPGALTLALTGLAALAIMKRRWA